MEEKNETSPDWARITLRVTLKYRDLLRRAADCSHEVTITEISGTMKGRDLLLVGRCSDCRGEVARVAEGL